MKEVEIKLRVSNGDRMLGRIAELGWARDGGRQLEKNFVFDTKDQSLRKSGRLLRIRTHGEKCTLTLKLPVEGEGAHKVKEEHEVEASDSDAMVKILLGLSYQATWRYEKYRTYFHRAGAAGEIVFDETPIGDFLELEGEPSWIDATAAILGYSRKDYITDTYGALFEKYKAGHPEASRDMVFPESE